KGASKGEGLGNQFLANIREVDAIIHVVRCFVDDNVIHVDGKVDPIADKDIIDTELILKDLETAEKAIERYKKAAKGGDKDKIKNVTICEKIKTHLEEGNPARTLEVSDDEMHVFKPMMLLTAKPILYVCNVDEDSHKSGNELSNTFTASVANEDAQVLVISAGIEADIAELETKEEREEFLEAMDIEQPGVNKVIHATYELLNLITYLTAGEKEVRAWTIIKGTKAPGAAGVIHTDFEKGFIRAEVIAYDDYKALGSEAAVKEAGKMKVEGKEYVVQDGDVMHFRFNV
ncbi:MAG: redox-regulated ATPase YchF, partial [Bacteroidota bacterium]